MQFFSLLGSSKELLRAVTTSFPYVFQSKQNNMAQFQCCLFLNAQQNKQIKNKAKTLKLKIFESSFIQSDHIYRRVPGDEGQRQCQYYVTQQLPHIR